MIPKTLFEALSPLPLNLHAVHQAMLLPSTQDFCHACPPPLHTWRLCLADAQSSARGQYQRHWDAPSNTGLWMSMTTQVPITHNPTHALSLAIATLIAKQLTPYLNKTASLKLKWPNDVMIDQQKIAGILVESSTQGNRCQWIIGIGINLEKTQPNFTWPTLDAFCQNPPNRLQLAADLYGTISEHFPSMLEDTTPYLNTWRKFDAFYQQPITFTHQEKTHTGISLGINDEGALLMQDDKGHAHSFTSGQLRPFDASC